MKEKTSDFRALLGQVSSHHDSRRVFEAFVRLSACALAAGTREQEYLDEAKHWERPELEAFSHVLGALVIEMEQKPFTDLLGSYYMQSIASRNAAKSNGEAYTPKHVCDLMAQVTLDSLPEEGPITVCEPACGAGAMILSLAQACPPEARRRLRVTAVDINPMACHMTFINTTLWGIPTRVIHGNAISLKCWAAWSNIHWAMPWLPLALRTETKDEQGEPPKAEEVERIRAALDQQEFSFK